MAGQSGGGARRRATRHGAGQTMTQSQAAEPQALAVLPGTLVLVGAGKMGSAVLTGWLGRGADPGRIAVIEPRPAAELVGLSERGLRLNPPAGALSEAAVVVLAVKPQQAETVVPAIAPLVGAATLVMSIMAGRTIAGLAGGLPAGTAIVRCMPNTPAAIGRGITVAVPNGQVTPAQRELAGRLLVATGAVEWIDDESQLDAVTAVSGSGPAYVFLLAETLAAAGVAAGLPVALAERLARATVAGSGALLEHSGIDPATLRQNVTSPGGTTQAALSLLMQPDGLPTLMRAAVAAAAQRSRELAR
jgi:pyrroline-5-carboxylate reductase